jgi:hypothetical protein
VGTRSYLAIVITVVWAASYIGSVATGDYTGFEAATPVMLLLATALLTADINRRGKNGNGGNGSGPHE